MQLSFEFPADPGVLGEIGEHVADAGCKAGFDDGEIGDIQLAVDEACTNTIMHGLENDLEQSFQLIIQWEKYEIEVLIRENGKPFDPQSIENPNVLAPLENRRIGGLGIYFIHKIMDALEYRIEDDGMKTTRMVKRKTDK